jgi:hypothetical protein
MPRLVKEVQLIADGEGARRMIQQLSSVVLRAMGIDSEFGNHRPEIQLRSGTFWSDIRSIHPKALSVAAWLEPYGDTTKGYIAQYVLDTRNPEVVAVLPEMFRLRVPLIFHHLKAELFTLWTLGLDPDLWLAYDTFLAAACIHLGLHHPRQEEALDGDVDEEIDRVQKAREKHERLLSLAGQCKVYDLAYPFGSEKNELRDRWRLLRDDEPITADLAAYAAADATWTLRLYAAQQREVVRQGMSYHLYTIEFPFAVANARMEWRGVLTSPEAMAKLRQGCEKAMKYCERHLKRLAKKHRVPMKKPGSAAQFLALMDALRLGDCSPSGRAVAPGPRRTRSSN